MGLLQRAVVGRWFTRWLLRGGPWSVAAKLAAVVLYGAWKWRRDKRNEAAAVKRREVSADYEVLGRDQLGPPSSSGKEAS